MQLMRIPIWLFGLVAVFLAASSAYATVPVNEPPVAECQDVTVSADAACTADADVDNGSSDPDGDVLTLTQSPTGPYPLGPTPVTLTVDDGQGGTASCTATVTVVDDTPPQIWCNTPATITPPDAPITFAVTATDNCGSPTVEILAFDCFAFTPNGRRIDKTESCIVSLSGNMVTIDDSGGIGDTVSWTIEATDAAGNTRQDTCEVEVVRP